MSNEKLIEQAREAIDNMDDFARMANVVATGPLLVLNSAIDALELADKRIAELEKYGRVQDPLADRIAELEHKLSVAREALKYAANELADFGVTLGSVEEALAQIGKCS